MSKQQYWDECLSDFVGTAGAHVTSGDDFEAALVGMEERS